MQYLMPSLISLRVRIQTLNAWYPVDMVLNPYIYPMKIETEHWLDCLLRHQR